MKNRTNTRWLTQLALLVAVLLVMNYTPLGYLQVGPLSMSLLTIPVAILALLRVPSLAVFLAQPALFRPCAPPA
jgi:thiamine transporter ThiT